MQNQGRLCYYTVVKVKIYPPGNKCMEERTYYDKAHISESDARKWCQRKGHPIVDHPSGSGKYYQIVPVYGWLTKEYAEYMCSLPRLSRCDQ